MTDLRRDLWDVFVVCQTTSVLLQNEHFALLKGTDKRFAHGLLRSPSKSELSVSWLKMDFGSKSSEKYRAMEVCFVATNKLNQAKGTCTGKTCDERMRTLCFSPIFPLLFLIGTAYISRYHTYSYIIYAFRPHRCDRLRSDCWMTGTYRNPRPG